jgi:WD40 repeat protein
MTDTDDNNDIPSDDVEERFSDGVPTVPETRGEEPVSLMDASTVAMGRTVDENAPFPQIDGYDIIEAMQAGGQGKLYKARELTPAGREVVLKFPRAGVLSSERAIALFENEVQKAASLDHPNIARIYSSGLYDRMPFYSMEFIDGVELHKYVKQANLGQREILGLVRTICLAVQHAHQRQIVHRDLKPANVMVTRDGAVPKLLDFGLAIEETQLQVTIDRGVGTLVYMSPEQAAYEPVTTQTDVYSLGVIFYELLTGEHPHGFTQQEWQTLSPGQFRDRVANGDVVRPSRANDRIDKELEALLLKALAHEPAERYASAGELAADINNYITGEPLTAKAPTTVYFLKKRLRKYRVQVAIATVVLAVLIGTAVFAYVSVTWERNRAIVAEGEALLERNTARAAEGQSLRRLIRTYRNNAWRCYEAEDASGSLLWNTKALSLMNELPADDNNVGVEELNIRIRIRQVLSEFLAPLVFWTSRWPAEGTKFLSPDLKRLAIIDAEDKTVVRIWDVDSSLVVSLPMRHKRPVTMVAFDPHGRKLATATDGGVSRLWDTTTSRPLSQPTQHGAPLKTLEFSDNSKSLLTVAGPARVWDANTGKPITRWLDHNEAITDGRFSDDSKRVLTVSKHLAQAWDAKSGRVVGVPLRMNGELGGSAVFSADGMRIVTWPDHVQSGGYQGGPPCQVWDTRMGHFVGPKFERRAYKYTTQIPVIAPNGKYVATGIALWDVDRVSTLQSHATTVGQRYTSGEEFSGAWFSKDGERVGIIRGPVAIVSSTSDRWLPQTIRHPSDILSLGFSPKRKRVMTSSLDGAIRLWDIEYNFRRNAVPCSAYMQYFPARPEFSPNGKRIALIRRSDRSQNLLLFPPSQSHYGFEESLGGIILESERNDPPCWRGKRSWEWIRDVADNASFTSDGRCIFFKNWQKPAGFRRARLWVLDAVSGDAMLVRLKCEQRLKLAQFSNGGHHILTLSDKGSVDIWETSTGNRIRSLAEGGQVTNVLFGPKGRFAVIKRDDSTLRVWDVETGTLWPSPLSFGKHPNHPVRSMTHLPTFSKSGKHILLRGKDIIQVWDIAMRKHLGPPIPKMTTDDGLDVRIQLTSNGAKVLYWAEDGFQLLNTKTGEVISEHRPDADIASVTFSPDGNRFAVCSNGSVRVWNSGTGHPVTTAMLHDDLFQNVNPFPDTLRAKFSPDSKRLVTFDNNVAIVWDAETGKAVTSPMVHDSDVHDAVFSPDGSRIAIACGGDSSDGNQDDYARVWDASTGKSLTRRLRSERAIYQVQFSPDGKQVLGVDSSGDLHAWEVCPDTRPAADLLLLAEFLSLRTIEGSGAVRWLGEDRLSQIWRQLKAKYADSSRLMGRPNKPTHRYDNGAHKQSGVLARKPLNGKTISMVSLRAIYSTGEQIVTVDGQKMYMAKRYGLVKGGDTLRSIAKAVYGNSAYWTLIAKENPGVNLSRRLRNGDTVLLHIPPKPAPTTRSDNNGATITP